MDLSVVYAVGMWGFIFLSVWFVCRKMWHLRGLAASAAQWAAGVVVLAGLGSYALAISCGGDAYSSTMACIPVAIVILIGAVIRVLGSAQIKALTGKSLQVVTGSLFLLFVFGLLSLFMGFYIPIANRTETSVFARRMDGANQIESIRQEMVHARYLLLMTVEGTDIDDREIRRSYVLTHGSGREANLKFLETTDRFAAWEIMVPVDGTTKWFGVRSPNGLGSPSLLELLVFDEHGVIHKRDFSYEAQSGWHDKLSDGNRIFECVDRDGSTYRYHVLEDRLDVIPASPETLTRIASIEALSADLESDDNAALDKDERRQADFILGGHLGQALGLNYYLSKNSIDGYDAYLRAGMTRGNFDDLVTQMHLIPKGQWKPDLERKALWAMRPRKPLLWWKSYAGEDAVPVFSQECGNDGVCLVRYEDGYFYYEAHVISLR